MPDESQTPAPVATTVLAHRDGPHWPDGSLRVINGHSPGDGGLYHDIPVDDVTELLGHGLDAPERVAATLKQKLEEALGLVDGTEVNKEIAAAVAKATEQANAERDAAVARYMTAEGDLAAAAKAYLAENVALDRATATNASLTTELAAGVVAMDLAKKDSAALRAEIATHDKQIAELKAQVDAKERQITQLLNEQQVTKAEGPAVRKK